MGKLKKLAAVLAGLATLTSPLWAPISSRLNIRTEDGTTSTYPYSARFTNGTVTDNGDGTVSITSGGGGGGGPNGSINTSAQYSSPYYSVTGSSNVLSGLSPGTSGQILTTQGSAGPPFWSGNLPSGASAYIQNTSSLQSNATFYVSSGTVGGQLVVKNSLYMNDGSSITNNSSSQPMYFNQPNNGEWLFSGVNNGSGNGQVDLTYSSLKFAPNIAGLPATQSLSFCETPTADCESIYFNPGYVSPSPGIYFFGIPTQSTQPFIVFATSTSANGANGSSVRYGLSVGSMTGAGLTTCGDSSHALSWASGSFGCQSIAGGGGPTLIATQTWSGQNNWTTPAQSTFTYGLSVGSLTTTGSGNLSIAENGITGQIVLSTAGTGVTVGHCAAFGSSMTVVDAGAVCGSGSGGGSGGLVSLSTGVITPATFAASSVTFTSSVTLNTGGGSPADNSTPGLMNVFQGASGYTGQVLFDVGSQSQREQFYVPNGQPVNMAAFGLTTGNMDLGVAGTTNRLTDRSRANWIDLQTASTMTFNTDNDLGGGDMIFQPQNAERFRMSAISGITATSSMTVLSSGGVHVLYNVNVGSITGSGLTTCGDSTHAVGYTSTTGLFSCQSVTGSGGSGSGIVSPGTFTWTNNFGMQVSTLQAINSTGPTSLVVSTSATGVSQLAVSSTIAVNPTDAILSISSTSGTTILWIDNAGNLISSGTTPTVSSCGTSPSVAGNNISGQITIGGGVVTACTLTFANGGFVNAPICIPSDNSATVSASNGATSATQAVFNLSATLGGGLLNYICIGFQK